MTKLHYIVFILFIWFYLPVAGYAENMVFPGDAGLVDVTQPPYNLVGDGKTDNTEALRQAFYDNRGTNRTLYFPNGTYLLSDRVNISGDEPSRAHSPHRFLHIQGQSEAGVILKLKDNAPGYADPENPKTFISLYEGQSTGDVMHEYVRNITVDVGKGNPGAAALRYISNNSGAMYDVTIRSSDPKKAGAIGLDLRQSQQGPALIKRVTVDGFDHGIEVGNSFSMVFEHIKLTNQRKAGFVNNNARTTMRGLTSRNRVPAITNGKHGNLTLIEAELQDGAKKQAAITTISKKIFLRDIHVSGYGHTVLTDAGESVDGNIDEWFAGKAYALFDCQTMQSLRLPIRETPRIPWETDVSQWVKVDIDGKKDGRTLQEAIDQAARQGKATVYFPKLKDKKKKYVVHDPIRVYGSVNRIIGMENILWVDGDKGTLTDGSVVFTFEDLDGPVVVERFFNVLKHGGWKGLYNMYLFENQSAHPVIIKNFAHGACLHKKPAPGKTWFIEDMAGGRQALFGKGEHVWMRQYNPESPDLTMCEIDGGQAWILGLKTEGRSRHIIARNGAKVELLGGVSYQSWKKQELNPPMFTV
ncbi:hypothetical protein GF373_13985, partial [bacterium]|nr:hypothetical protein [bacterium]